MDKKTKELADASFFLTRFNARYGTDYQAFPNNEEDKQNQWVDVFATSRSNRHQDLKLQLKTRDAILRQEEGRIRPKVRNEVLVMGRLVTIDPIQLVKKIVGKKAYSTEIERTLVLLITTDIGPLLNEGYAKENFAELQSSEYKGVYYVHLPSYPESCSSPHKGQIVTIKGIRSRDHGVSF